ncbi:DNA repair protein recO [Legionella moravica]|uniref:DNA repair protein RecO n=1 Tax=Legionella moravica TaxID=39962 RepID=A0A378K5U7_9GAMM|nr:DNA repair protein RecO [Legionella moravica]KTD31155.1 DNA repair protein recO [Legionella moravica]STX63221.1 DNA repair protein RecO (recombination protein O) [Legionella moravica]
MTAKSLQAWVIHKQWSGDTSARVTFFSRELGLVNCLCKGGRTPKKQSLLQPFTPLWVSVDERHDRYYTRTMESISPMLPLEGHSLFSGLYINELLYHALRPIYPDTELFDAYLVTLNGLATTENRLTIESILRRFEWALLHSCGHSFSWTEEARTGGLVRTEYNYQFIAGEGFVVSDKGIPGEHLLALAEDNLDEASCLKSAKRIMRQAIDHLLGGREIKARALYSSS